MPSAIVKKLDIVCFEHCGKKIFSFDLPDSCPECKRDLSDCDLKIPPFNVPNPFSRAQDHPCSVVIKPTRGDFLDDYQNRSNLHIAATNSRGLVTEYDQQGVHRDRTPEWNQCVVIDLTSQLDPEITLDPDWGEYWDLCLQKTADSFGVDSYHEDTNNCFNFILEFLKSLKQAPISQESANRVDFCQKYILPKTIVAGKYICLYRKVRDNAGVYVQAVKRRSVEKTIPGKSSPDSGQIRDDNEKENVQSDF